jgi:exopolyphosphatase / guanosine-5'-triphosphate,3'-diphosphate pyrophosphatase
VARCACIDIGSNTTRLLVAEDDAGRLRELFAERAFTRLGSACDEHGEIASQTIAEVAAVVARQLRLARELEVDSLRIVATAALRQALNGAALARAIEAACGGRLEILSAEEEARLAFAGAIGMLLSPPAGPLGVVDVGGGSTELVVGTAAGGVIWSVSLPVGSSVVTSVDLPSDPPTAAELVALRDKLARLFDGVSAPQPAAAFAVGGSATSLHRLVGAVLSREALARGLSALLTHPAAEVALRLGLHAERARLLPAGILLLDAAAKALRAPLKLAGGGLREGVLFEQLARVGTK